MDGPRNTFCGNCVLARSSGGGMFYKIDLEKENLKISQILKHLNKLEQNLSGMIKQDGMSNA